MPSSSDSSSQSNFISSQESLSTQVIVSARANLVVRQADGSPRMIPLKREPLTIGRHPTNTVVIDIATVSAEHAIIENIDGAYRLTDRNSKNGTFVNGQRIGVTMLHDGDIIRIGDARGNSVSLTFHAGHAPQATSLETFDLATFDRLMIGRDADCDLTLDSPLVSRQHARLERSGSTHTLIDLNSTNGTFVNSQRIDRVQLQTGDIVQIGPYRIIYHPNEMSQVLNTQRGRLDALHLTRRVGADRIILNDVSLSIAPREFVAIVGASGSGKSTLLNALSGFERAEGRVLLNGDDFYGHFDLYRNLIGYVPQDDIIHRELPVGQALRYTAQLRLPGDTSSHEIDTRIDRVLAEVELEAQHDQIVGQLSGGQRKRVSIGAELLAEPGVFFLDEATSGLDPGLEKKLMYTLRRLADGGRTIVLVTHATANITQCDHVAFLSEGQLVFFGPPSEALEFFGVKEFADIYGEIERDPQWWEKRFRESSVYERYVLSRLQRIDQPRSAHATGATRRKTNDKPLAEVASRASPIAPRANALRQFSILIQRYFELVVRDKVLLTVLLAVMPLVGILLATIAQPTALVGDSVDRIAQIVSEKGLYTIAGQTQTVLMMLALAAVLVGLFAASFELVRERAIYRRERMINLRLIAYIASKLTVLVGFATLQCMALIVVLAFRIQFPSAGILLPGPLEIYTTLLLASIAGILLGLFISAIVSSVNTVIYVVLLAVFVQIIFGGVIFDLPGAAKPLSYFTITRWTVEALGSTVDLPRLNNLGQIEVHRTIDTIDPLTGAKIQREVVYQDRLPATFTVDYAHTPDWLISRWAILLAFSIVLGALTALAQSRWSPTGRKGIERRRRRFRR
ncbi:MAG TPA: FHA domain-containing protein [Anaerolineae bacterium]|nr:FHA domain-containing protein [Anaerolineae bacterium]